MDRIPICIRDMRLDEKNLHLITVTVEFAAGETALRQPVTFNDVHPWHYIERYVFEEAEIAQWVSRHGDKFDLMLFLVDKLKELSRPQGSSRKPLA
jgi:hypothetical protein